MNEIVTSDARMPTMAIYDTVGTMGMTGAAKVASVPLEVKGFAPGDFLYLPAKNTHFGGAKGTTIIQLHGMGPFAINLGTP